MRKKREFIGIGREHIVYRSSANPNWVIKKPTAWAKMVLDLQGKGADYVRYRRDETLEKFRHSRVQLPETKVIGVSGGRSYLMLQRYIPDEKVPSVTNIPNLLYAENLPDLAQSYLESTKNFRTYNGTLYLIDFSITPNLDVLMNKLGIPEQACYVIIDHLPVKLYHKFMRFLG